VEFAIVGMLQKLISFQSIKRSKVEFSRAHSRHNGMKSSVETKEMVLGFVNRLVYCVVGVD